MAMALPLVVMAPCLPAHHGCAMAMPPPLALPACLPGLPWLYHGYAMALACLAYLPVCYGLGLAMALLWPWPCHGLAMALPWP